MMVMLVTLEQASDHLRRDTTDDNGDLTLKIKAASSAVMRYLKDGATFLNSSGEVETDTSGNPIGVPEDVQAATLLLIGFLYKNRDENADGAFDPSFLPAPVLSLLYPLRPPTLE